MHHPFRIIFRLPRKNFRLTHRNDLLPHKNFLLTHRNALLTRKNPLLFHQNTLLPHQNLLLPRKNIQLPRKNLLLPHQNTLLPHQNLLLPHRNALLPRKNDLLTRCHRQVAQFPVPLTPPFDNTLKFRHPCPPLARGGQGWGSKNYVFVLSQSRLHNISQSSDTKSLNVFYKRNFYLSKTSGSSDPTHPVIVRNLGIYRPPLARGG